MKNIYLACPYSHPDRIVTIYRFEEASRAAAHIMQLGHAVFSPISHSHPIAEHIGNHLSHDFWLKQDFAFFDWADELWVLTLDGWNESKGIKLELEEWRNKFRPLYFITPTPENNDYLVSSLGDIIRSGERVQPCIQ